MYGIGIVRGLGVTLKHFLETYLDGYNRFRKHSGFTAAEQEVVFLTLSRGNGCDYCMAAHSVIADQMSRVPAPVTEAIRTIRRILDHLGMHSPPQNKPPPVREILRVAEHDDGWGVSAEWD